MLTRKDFRLTPETGKRNLALCSAELLYTLAGEGASEKLRIPCIAELISRRFLNRRDNQLAEAIDKLLPNGERKSLERTLDEDFLNKPSKETLEKVLWQTDNDFSRKCHTAVSRRLISLCCETDGFIPVYSGEKAFFIPFRFEEGESRICDLNGKTVEGWQEHYCVLFGKNSNMCCVVSCDQQGIPPLQGSSLMLPLYLAYLRRTGKLSYNHLRLLATGSIVSNHIEPVQTAEKSSALKKCFGDAFLFFPESSQYTAVLPYEIPLPAGTALGELEEKLKLLIEAKGLVTPTFRDAIRRLEQLAHESESNYSKWQLMLDRLETNAQAVPDYRSPEKYLLCLMLRSAIYCHMGNTDAALSSNREAQEFARENGMEKQLRRLEVEELVEFQDKELFDKLLPLAAELKENIEKLKDPDLLMRYYGTMGQAHSYGSLVGKEGYSRETALACFKKAVRYACQCPSEAAPLEYEANMAQDLNYLVLWHALFAPESPELKKAYSQADAHIKSNLHGSFAVQNRAYLKRCRAFSLYRCFLENGTLPECDADAFLQSAAVDSWLRAATDKYIGTLYAAAGKTAEAEKLFEEGISLIKEYSHPIIKSIYLTVLCQAFESLGKEEYRSEAWRVLEELKSEFPGSMVMWQEYLLGKGPFPGLKYWY